MLSLKSLVDYLQKKQLATVDTIAQAFQVEGELVKHMLQRLIKNGCVVCIATSACSTACGECVLKCQEVYRLT